MAVEKYKDIIKHDPSKLYSLLCFDLDRLKLFRQNATIYFEINMER